MGIDVYYQPIDVGFVHGKLLPFIFDDRDLGDVSPESAEATEASAMLVELKSASHCLAQGIDYHSPKWGHSDPEDFLADFCVPVVLEFCRAIWPYWHVRAFTSIQLLPDGFPILENYSMPTELFSPIIERFPNIAAQLATIAECESMGGVVLRRNVRNVREGIVSEHKKWTRDPANPYDFDAAEKLIEALQYAEVNGLDFTEAIT